MTMSIYYIDPDAAFEGAVAVIQDSKSRYAKYLMWDEGGGEFLKFNKSIAVAQDKLGKMRAKDGIDFIPTNIGIPILSSRAKQALEKFSELEFHPCDVKFETENSQFFLVKTHTYINLIDVGASSFRVLSGGEKILSQPAYVRNPSNFIIARDIIYKERLVASSNFKDIVDQAGLNIFLTQV